MDSLFFCDTVDGRNPAPVGNYWDYDGISHLPTGAGFLPSTVLYNII